MWSAITWQMFSKFPRQTSHNSLGDDVISKFNRHRVLLELVIHDDVIKWKHFPRYWPFVRGIHLSSVNSPHKGQWRGALMFSLICVWINGWVNNRKASDLRRHRGHYDVNVMKLYRASAVCVSDENTFLFVLNSNTYNQVYYDDTWGYFYFQINHQIYTRSSIDFKIAVIQYWCDANTLLIAALIRQLHSYQFIFHCFVLN